jgi:MFS family permease
VVRSTLLSRWFAVVFTASLASEVTHSLLVHVPGFMLKVGANEVRIGVYAGLAGVAAILVRPAIGRTMDRRSRRLVIRSGTALLAIACLGYTLVTNAGPLLASVRVVQGIADAMTYTAFFTYVADRIPPERRTHGLALFGISGLAPIGIGSSLGDLLLRIADYRTLFVVAAAFSGVAFLLAMTLESSGVKVGATPHGFKTVLLNRALRPIWLGAAMLSIGFATVFVFVKTYVDTSGLSSVGPFFVAYAATAVLLRTVFGRVPDRVGPRKVVVPGILGYAACFAALALIGSNVGLVLAGAFGGFGHGVTFPVLLSMSTTRADPDSRGATTSVFTAILDGGLLAFGPLLGVIITGPGYPAMFGVVAAFLCAGAWVFSRMDHVATPEPFTETPVSWVGQIP